MHNKNTNSNNAIKTKNRIFACIFLLLILYTIDRVFIHPSYHLNNERYLRHQISSHDNTNAYLHKIRDENEREHQQEMLIHDLRSEAGTFFHPNHPKRYFHHAQKIPITTATSEKQQQLSWDTPFENAEDEYEKRKEFLIHQQHESELIQRSWDSIRKIPENKFDRCEKFRGVKEPGRMSSFPEFTRREKDLHGWCIEKSDKRSRSRSSRVFRCRS
jgi:hypothetical protein